MNKESKDFLHKLLSTPSPTGFEERIQRIVRRRMEKYADVVESDLHGNLIVGINVKNPRKVMLAGHCDQIGFMVRYISPEGYIYVAPLGGIDAGVLPGAQVTIYGNDGVAIPGVIGRKPIHSQTHEEREKNKVDIEKVWIDIGAKDDKEVEKLITIGDCVTFSLGVTELRNQLFCAPGLDDRVGVFVAMEALRLCSGSKLNVGLYAVSTVQEEVGLRGAKTAAFGIDPMVGIAVDVTHASDNPAEENKKAMPCKIGGGPTIPRGPNVNPVVYRRLIEAAKKHRLPYQPAISARLFGNDANAIQVSRAGVAAGAVEIPNRYMHTQAEICSYKDLENSAKLLAAFIKDIGPRTDFIPN